ncbi:MAG TPA: ATP-binding protein [Anaerolineae bacterium]|nr:ATP-binding protein [Anaerolineae bacterium]
MPVYPLRIAPVVERLLPWLMLGLLFLFTYAFFVAVPYAGFRYQPTGQVVELYVTPSPPAELRLNDRLLQVGPISWSDFSRDFRLALFEGVKPGDEVPLAIERDGQMLTIPWVFPGPTLNELLQRLNSQWFLAYFFWLAGTLVLLSVRPKEVRRRLLIAFYYLTALWLITGSGAASAHVWQTALVLQSAVWLSLPVYWHLHWSIPEPLRHLSKRVGWVLYGIAAILAVAPWLGLIPPRLYQYGLLLAVVGAMVLLLLHFFLRPAQRRDIRLLVFLAVLAAAPSIAVNMAQLGDVALPFYAAGASLLALPLLPIGYFYAAYRRRLGGMELHRNRLLALYLFFVGLGTALIVLYAVASIWLNFSGNVLFVGVAASLLTGLITILGYMPFQRFVEHRLLGVPSAPAHLLETYAARIATRLDRPGLVNLLRDEILPGLLVRQSALLHLGETQRMTALYRRGVGDADLPSDNDISALLAEAGQYRYRLQAEDSHRPQPCAWVRLALPLRLGDRLIGLWLLGSRDPDDEYAQPEIAVLQALADQTAIALAHIVQSELLRVAYKADVDRMEAERASLARELHDHVLGDLAALKGNAELRSLSADFLEIYNRVTTSLRQTITGLRPTMLNYGLPAALNSLVDALADRTQPLLAIELRVPETNVRYAADLEQHLYRIVQQACENALLHAQARRLTIHGHLEQDRIDLTVEDEGVGFETGERLDLAGLIARQHFGLAGMYERATLIQAKLRVDSTPGRGTRIGITWSSSGNLTA